MRRHHLIFASLLVTTAIDINAAPVFGSTINFTYYFPDLLTPYVQPANGNYIVGSGIEVPDMAQQIASIDITSNQVIVDFSAEPYGSTGFSAAAFNGFILSDALHTIDSISSVTIDPSTNIVGFNNSRLLFSPDAIQANFEGLFYDPSSRVVLDFTTVPEPASVALLGAALVVSVGFVRKRRAM